LCLLFLFLPCFNHTPWLRVVRTAITVLGHSHGSPFFTLPHYSLPHLPACHHHAAPHHWCLPHPHRAGMPRAARHPSPCVAGMACAGLLVVSTACGPFHTCLCAPLHPSTLFISGTIPCSSTYFLLPRRAPARHFTPLTISRHAHSCAHSARTLPPRRALRTRTLPRTPLPLRAR